MQNLDVTSSTLLGNYVQIPYGDYDGLDLTPFVRISGIISTLVELPETTSV